MATTARPRMRTLKHFVLHVYGYSGDGFDLTELTGWPQSLKPILAGEIESLDVDGPTLIWFTGDEREFTLEEACMVLNILRDNHLGYSASMTPFWKTLGNDKVLYAWLESPDGHPQVTKQGPRDCVSLVRNLLKAKVVERYPKDFPGSRHVSHELHDVFRHNVKLLHLADFNETLGG